jgi:hypothetical protein
MSPIDQLALYIGQGVVIIAVAIATYAFLSRVVHIQYTCGLHFIFTVFGFGIINLDRGNVMLPAIFRVRGKDAGFVTGGRIIFLSTPNWLTKYIYDTGVKE